MVESLGSTNEIRALDFKYRLKIYAAVLNDIRLTILKKLAETDSSLTFSDLQQVFHLNPNTLTYHLRVLKDADLVHNSYVKSEKSRAYSHYSLTPVGRVVLRVDDLTKLF